MNVTHFDIENGPVLMTTQVYRDDRGCFHESYHAKQVKEALGFDPGFVQDNVSHSATKGTLRGLHMQLPPHMQGKFVQCLQGEIWDVAIDARPNSDTLGQSVGVTLSSGDGNMIWVPPGFLHGFVTRTDAAIVTYKVTAYYQHGSDVSVAWDDPALGLDWGLTGAPILSEKDENGMLFAELMTRLEGTA